MGEKRGALREILVDSSRELAFAFQYVGREFLGVDLRPQFGLNDSLGRYGLVTSAIEHEHIRMTQKSIKFTPAGIRATKHVQIAPPSSGKRISPVPA